MRDLAHEFQPRNKIHRYQVGIVFFQRFVISMKRSKYSTKIRALHYAIETCFNQ